MASASSKVQPSWHCSPKPGAPPRVTGVEIEQDSGVSRISADIVIDASGRHGASDAWLAAIGAKPVEQESSPCGIFYTSRFYRLKDGVDYPALDGRKSTAGGVQGADLGYMKVGLFRADNRTFSITLAADPEDKPMRAVSRDTSSTSPSHRSKRRRPGSIRTPRRRSARLPLRQSEQYAQTLRGDGGPVALNYFAIGDAHVHTNPISGRGCALGWVSAFELARVLTATSRSGAARRRLRRAHRCDGAAAVSAAGRSGQTVDRDQQSTAARRRSVQFRKTRRLHRRRRISGSRSSAKAWALPRENISTSCVHSSATPTCWICRRHSLRARICWERCWRATKRQRRRNQVATVRDEMLALFAAGA